MEKTFRDAMKHRRTYYSLTGTSLVEDNKIEEIIKLAVTHIPSAFNSQSARVVLLLNAHHAKLWSIVMESLRKIVPAENFAQTESKINSFAAAYASILYFEETAVVRSLQEQFPSYADNFPLWSQQTSAMHQFAIWTMLEEVGFGASIQHYNILIDAEVHKEWNIPESWQLIAQMPFGVPSAEPGEKSFQPLETRIKIFK
jgi:uncharacterized protein